MATSVWRMNGICRRMAGILVLCTLLISSEVMCQDGTTITATVAATTDGGTGAAVSTVTSVVTSALDVVTHAAVDVPDAAAADAAAAAAAATAAAAAAGAAAAGAAASAAPGDGTILETRVDILVPTGPPVVGGDNKGSEISGIPDVSNTVKVVVPDVVCVGKEDLPESDAVKAVVHTTDCEATKRIIMDNAAPWCEKENCNLKIFQEDNTVSLASSDASHSTLASALQSEHLKDKLGVTKTETPSSSSSSVFVGILVTGLLCALAITVGYFKCQRKTETKGARLAEEAYPVDQENQGNTLVSVAPLNPPPETEEKPSVNGESPEAPKTEPAPPPTNGHSTTKTADTEL